MDGLPCIPIAAKQVQALSSPQAFRETLLAHIAQARQRILMATLYLQDDEAGREILSALYAAKNAQPQLEIAVFVDWHRAQRGLIGKTRSAGNAAMYKDMARRLGPGITIYGVPVQRREFMGVMHLKGFIIDDSVLYSGASLNDVYLHRHLRYRLDRYHLIHNRALADSMAALLTGVLRGNPAIHPLDSGKAPKTVTLLGAIVKLRRELAKTRYHFAPGVLKHGEVGITPLLGLGVRDNELNLTILQLIRQAQQRLVLFTPYFNLPGPIRKALDNRIRSGCRVTIVLGDKTANDFYIPPDEPFKTIGALPYLYEANLRRYCKAHQRAIDAGLLNVHLWRDEDNTFHLKGLLVDDDYALLTGNNLNPRAWRLDLENGLVIHDPQKLLLDQHLAELERILAHTRRLDHHQVIDAVESYPDQVQRLLRRLARVRADRLVNQVL
ncbi:MAG: CDP-diacylglycerol--serine O-phosphatidyltransferase [Propionivibrio sp.]|uniref:CDP-diacylglycerol--serine O-phosphatidyltransferase n=1 Tax=Candidatus Propionivibrio dominans TaxID=2954373 RepID=A0A9D7FC74_9RHOO|nr:CDP-diacylglycerol--serine O-phosphatidyltransferase [Candidatus Propionivibrio dominans]